MGPKQVSLRVVTLITANRDLPGIPQLVRSSLGPLFETIIAGMILDRLPSGGVVTGPAATHSARGKSIASISRA